MMKTPVHKIELYVVEVNNNDCGLEDIKTRIENMLDNEIVVFAKCETKEAGEWSDEHKLNLSTTDVPKYFSKLK